MRLHLLTLAFAVAGPALAQTTIGPLYLSGEPGGPTGGGSGACPSGPPCGTIDTPGGMAFDGTNLWIASYAVQEIQMVEPLNCCAVHSIPAPAPDIGGLAWDGSSLWAAAEQSSIIYQLDPADGAILGTIPGTGTGDGDPNAVGLAWDGTHLWQADHNDEQIHMLDTEDGTILRSIPAPGPWSGGLAYSGGFFIVGDVTLGQTFWVDSTDGEVKFVCDDTYWGFAPDGAGGVWSADFSTSMMQQLDFNLPTYTRFCTSTINSSGAAARIRAEGTGSISSNNLVLEASPVPSEAGFFFYGSAPVQQPSGNGFRCIGGNMFKLPIVFRAGDALTYAVDFKTPPTNMGPGAIVAGSTWYFQAIFRDTANGGSGGFNYSDGMEILFAL
ncbi:MAG: hypothetical protein GY711_27395 [bacterium]|nr:hypothetical protein [bacterium]